MAEMGFLLAAGGVVDEETGGCAAVAVDADTGGADADNGCTICTWEVPNGIIDGRRQYNDHYDDKENHDKDESNNGGESKWYGSEENYGTRTTTTNDDLAKTPWRRSKMTVRFLCYININGLSL